MSGDIKVNSQNLSQLRSVSFKKGGLFNDNKNGYEYLFNTTDAAGHTAPVQSLFNVTNMQRLCELGDSTPNIVSNQSAILEGTFTLESEWFYFAKDTLGLPDENHLYLIWLWMENAW